MFKNFFNKQETISREPSNPEKVAARKWNTMNPFEHDRVLFKLCWLGKIEIGDVTGFRMVSKFEDLPKHIRSGLTDYWDSKK